MDLLVLDSNDFFPTGIVEGWTSLIWTERFQDAGEFQFKTPMVAETISKIPEGSFVSLRETAEVMIVENHSIGYDANGVPELTTTGRSFAVFLENRFNYGDYNQPYDMLHQYDYQDAVACLIWNALANGTTVNVDGSSRARIIDDLVFRTMVCDRMTDQTGLSVGAVGSLFELHDWTVQPGEVYSKVLDWLRLGNLGLRTIRPETKTLVYEMTTYFETAGGPPYEGTVYHANTYFTGRLKFEIYNGRIRTQTPAPAAAQSPVIFRYDAGHIESPTYLRSAKGFKNVAFVVCPDGELFVYGNDPDPSGDGDYTGASRRAMLVDLGTIDSSVVDLNQYMLQQGQIALKNANILLMADGAISPSTPLTYGWNEDYFLGDVVTVVGEYGVREDMVVTEYVRNQDASGVKAYPTLVHKT